MRTVAYVSPFVPAEWIAAHGLRPRRILPASPAEDSLLFDGMGVCPFCRAFCGEVSRGAGDAIIVATECDQMRRAAERIAEASDAPVFLFNVPATWQSSNARRLYEDELRRLGRFLVGLGGAAPRPDDLAVTMRAFDDARAALQALRGRLTTRAAGEALAAFHRSPETFVCPEPSASVRHSGVPLILLGPELYRNHFELFDQVEEAGGWIALDATTSGERGLPAPFDRRLLGDDPFGALAQSYFDSLPDAFRRPDSALYDYVKREIPARGARGIILRVYSWCDMWRAEARRLKEWSPVPVLEIDVADEPSIHGRLSVRLHAFLESLQ